MTRSVWLLAAGVALVSLHGAAEAATNSETVYSTEIVATSSAKPNNSESISVPEFNQNLGSLDSVELTYYVEYFGSATAVYSPSGNNSVSLLAAGQLGQDGSDVYLVDGYTASSMAMSPTCGWNCVQNPGSSGPGVDTIKAQGEKTSSVTLTSPVDLKAFEGNSPVVLDDDLSAKAMNGQITALASVGATYDYTPEAPSDPTTPAPPNPTTPPTPPIPSMPPVSAAPEPSLWALMILGIGGIGLALRQAKRKHGFRFKDAFAA